VPSNDLERTWPGMGGHRNVVWSVLRHCSFVSLGSQIWVYARLSCLLCVLGVEEHQGTLATTAAGKWKWHQTLRLGTRGTTKWIWNCSVHLHLKKQSAEGPRLAPSLPHETQSWSEMVAKLNLSGSPVSRCLPLRQVAVPRHG